MTLAEEIEGKVTLDQALGEFSRRSRLAKELSDCLKLAMEEWSGWQEDSRGTKPRDEDWKRCKKALEQVTW